ncbi:MAG: phage terminase large subunit, partial [Alphaproteobacteria bacterium]|nr:phage terminase large subunit [Alphaproteobacteria bacterium]
KAGDAYSDAEREKVNDWYDQTVSTRLDDKKNGVILVVMQRIHENDLVGHLLEKGGWNILNLPAIATEPQSIPIGPHNKFHHRKPGDVLHPEREDLEYLKRQQADMGSVAFAAQYQQAPVPPGGNMIKPEWFKNFENRRGQGDYDLIVQSWDTASGTDKSRSYSVCLTFGVKENRYYLLDVIRDHMDFPTLKARVIRHAGNWGANHILIEKASSGIALLEVLLRETSLPIISVPPDSSKKTRVDRVSAYIEAGRVYLPKDESWLATFIQEICAFPNGKFDDQVDALTHFLYWAQERDYRPQGRFITIGGRSGDRYRDRTGNSTF